MAKQARRVLRTRKEEAPGDDSVLIRSAESLGRVIGSLQKQMQDGSKRVSSLAGDALNVVPDLPRLDTLFGGTARPARKRVTRARKTKRAGGTRKAAGARK